MTNGWQKGKGKGKGTCWTCGQQGHRRFECPGTGGKGPVCWTCGQAGHRQQDCPDSSKGTSKGGGKGIRELGDAADARLEDEGEEAMAAPLWSIGYLNSLQPEQSSASTEETQDAPSPENYMVPSAPRRTPLLQ